MEMAKYGEHGWEAVFVTGTFPEAEVMRARYRNRASGRPLESASGSAGDQLISAYPLAARVIEDALERALGPRLPAPGDPRWASYLLTAPPADQGPVAPAFDVVAGGGFASNDGRRAHVVTAYRAPLRGDLVLETTLGDLGFAPWTVSPRRLEGYRSIVEAGLQATVRAFVDPATGARRFFELAGGSIVVPGA